jgi:hypothetical protein
MTSTGIVLVVLIACLTGVAMHYISEKNKAAENASDEGADDLLAQLDAIEERVRVLERIITENKFDLKREIEGL